MHRLTLFLLAIAAFAQPRPVTYASLSEGQAVSGFKTVAVYLDDSDRAMGARFRHERSGFAWVRTYPSSNMGDPTGFLAGGLAARVSS